jgi:hypothetical protein
MLGRQCLLKRVIEGEIVGSRRRGRTWKQLLYNLKKKRKYWNLKNEALDSSF